MLARACRVVPLMVLAACLPLVVCAQATHPARTALISSSGVNGDKRSWSEYDSQLGRLGWQVDKVANTDVGKLLAHAADYDLILTTSLWNYGDPQDMAKHAAAISEYLRNGGTVVLTDMSYPPMCDWLPVLDPGLTLAYGEAGKELGDRAQLDAKQPWPVLQCPHKVPAVSYWAHYSKWGPGWTVMLRTKAGTAVMLGKRIGMGALICTTGFGFDAAALENVYTTAQALKAGLRIAASFPAAAVMPADLRGTITLENVTNEARALTVGASLVAGGRTLAIDPMRVTLQGGQTTTVPVAFGKTPRDASRIDLSVSPGLVLSQPVSVFPLLSARLNRTVFASGDTVVVTLAARPQVSDAAGARWQVRLRTGKREIRLADGPARSSLVLKVPASKLRAGKCTLIASVTAGSEKDSSLLDFEVRAARSVPTPCRIGQKGELLVRGKPTLLLGTYHADQQDLQWLKEMGFNCVTGPIFGVDQVRMNEGQVAWMDEAQRCGLGVLQELSDYPRSQKAPWEAMRRMASDLRLHPATIAHYAVDEPSLCGLAPEVIAEQCTVLREADPEHPALVLDVPGAAPAYARCGAAIGSDPYPISSGTPASLASVGEAMDRLVAKAQGRPVWPALQAFRQPPAGPSNRFATLDEVRCMSYLALNHGAKGLLYYCWADQYDLNGKPWPSGMKYDEALVKGMPGLLAELCAIGPEYLLGDVTKVGATGPAAALDIVRIRRAGRTTVIAVNPTSSIVEASVPVGDKTVAHRFAPFEVWVAR